MTGPEFHAYWHAHYGTCPPIGHVLRQRFPDRWMRIHSLPDSQRYPANKGDWRILLDRQNRLCSDLLGEGSAFLLVGGDYVDMSEERYGVEGPLAEHPAMAGIPLTLAWRAHPHRFFPDDFEPDIRFDVFLSAQHWHAGALDKVLRAIAEDEMRLLLVSATRQIVVAPYDGGVDVILPDTMTRDVCLDQYRDWLSPYDHRR